MLSIRQAYCLAKLCMIAWLQKRSRTMDDDRYSDAGRKGGEARAAALSDEERSEIARKAAAARWNKATAESEGQAEHEPEEILEPVPAMPIARWRGSLNIVGLEVPCYVLDNGQKIIGR